MKKTLLMLALVAGIASFAQNAQAALITINIGPTGFDIGGTSGGVEFNNSRSLVFPISGNGLTIFNGVGNGVIGLEGYDGLTFAAGLSPATPEKFALNGLIGSGSTYVDDDRSVFQLDFDVYSPRFESGSYMGFKTSQGNYGWLEVRWEPPSGSEFQILSGAYWNTPNVAILAGGGAAAPIPEPGTWAAMAIFAGGAAFAGWRRRKSAKVAA